MNCTSWWQKAASKKRRFHGLVCSHLSPALWLPSVVVSPFWKVSSDFSLFALNMCALRILLINFYQLHGYCKLMHRNFHTLFSRQTWNLNRHSHDCMGTLMVSFFDTIDIVFTWLRSRFIFLSFCIILVSQVAGDHSDALDTTADWSKINAICRMHCRMVNFLVRHGHWLSKLDIKASSHCCTLSWRKLICKIGGEWTYRDVKRMS